MPTPFPSELLTTFRALAEIVYSGESFDSVYDAVCTSALDALAAAARADAAPLLEPLRAALAARCTVGEVCGTLRAEWGSYDSQVSDGR